ncbi:MAG: LuxR C-terminal-related transcriptional regulator [Rhodospirillaceae bacterium]|nr:LuxR C-terminal-related transcriptional regulator [Rhodospirillaceae bacterium]
MARSELTAFERILAALHEAALDPARWPGASALIDEALGTHGNALACGDGEAEEDYRTYFLWICHRGQRRRDLERLWLETYYPLDEGVPRLRQRPFNRLIHIAGLYTEEELKTSESFDILRTRAHAGNSIYVRLGGTGGSRLLWQVNDPLEGDGWSSAQRDTIRRLLPHIRQTVHVQQTLARADALGATLTEMLDHSGMGIVQLDLRGRIVAANDRARDVLRSGDGLFDEGGSLFARRPEEQARLQALLARALPPSGAKGAGGSASVSRSDGLPPLVLHVHPVGPQETDFQVWPVAALVLVVDPANGTAVDPAAAADALGLTQMEGRVAVLLAQGMSVHQIAAATGRKESTIRSHVKHMFAKHGLSRQAELVRLVQSVAASPQGRPHG